MIRALEKRIAKVEGDVIKLKRDRNSLLNISRLPDKILGYIFERTLSWEQGDLPFLDPTFNGLEKGSYNFLFVYRKWFDVASSTPEVWRFWGNTLQDWDKLCRLNRAALVDLVLDRRADGPQVLSIPLREELEKLVTGDRIRQIHLRTGDLDLLGSILHVLAPDGERVQEKRIESIIFHTTLIPERILDFFARLRLPWLRCLEIFGCLQTPLWDHLISQTTRLTTLSLQLTQRSVPLSTSQLDSILVANPNLQNLTLENASLPDEIDEPGVPVSLHHLKRISLRGEFRSVFQLLQRLELPGTLEHTELHMKNSPLEDIHKTFGPYMRNLFQRDAWWKNRLDVMSTVHRDVYIHVCPRTCYPTETSNLGRVDPTAVFSISVIGSPPTPVLKKLSLDLIALIPQEQVESLQMEHTSEVSEELFIGMPNLTSLWIQNVTLSDGFLQPGPSGPRIGRKLFPSLLSLTLSDVAVENDNWRPLINCLPDKTSEDEAFRLYVTSKSRMPSEVMEEIRGLVRELEFSQQGYDNWGNDWVSEDDVHL